MAWFWSSWKEYESYISPVLLNRPNVFKTAKFESWFEVDSKLFEAREDLEKALSELYKLGFRDEQITKDALILDEARAQVDNLIFAGEELLLYHKRLAISKSSAEFLYQHDIINHWDRYSGTSRIYREITKLVDGASELMTSFDVMMREDADFLIKDIDLPNELMPDFYLARNLFSVGFDETGVLMTGRGFEGVLRAIAKKLKVSFKNKDKLEPASETDLHNLIEVISQLRWKKTGKRVLSADQKTLLHYLRTLRNQKAHPGSESSSDELREKAVIFSKTADRLWKEINSTRAKLESTTIQRTW